MKFRKGGHHGACILGMYTIYTYVCLLTHIL